jgi:hypothetical protein
MLELGMCGNGEASIVGNVAKVAALLVDDETGE